MLKRPETFSGPNLTTYGVDRILGIETPTEDYFSWSERHQRLVVPKDIRDIISEQKAKKLEFIFNLRKLTTP